MQETLHTISPLTSPMDQMRSKRNIAIGLILVGAFIIISVVWYALYQKQHVSYKPPTDEQKAAVISNLQRKIESQPKLTDEQKAAVIKAQGTVVASTPSLTDEQKAEIIKQINQR